MTAPHTLPFLFKGGYRLISQGLLEDLIQRAMKESVPASVLRYWCGFLDSLNLDDFTFDNRLMLDTKLRRTMTGQSYGMKPIRTRFRPSFHELFQIQYFTALQRGDGAFERGDYHVKIPREVLRYLCLVGTKSEIIFVLVACTRMMRRQQYKFRINQVELSARLGISRASLSRAVNRLITNGMIRRIKSPVPFVRAHGQQYQFMATIGVGRTKEYPAPLDIIW